MIDSLDLMRDRMNFPVNFSNQTWPLTTAVDKVIKQQWGSPPTINRWRYLRQTIHSPGANWLN